MTTAASGAGHNPQQFQFRLGTLLLGMTWAGLVCVALRSPTAFWSGALFVFTMLVLLTVVLVAVYRAGRTRAFAVGFLVFSVGYLGCLAIVAGSLSNALLRQGWTPLAGASDWLYQTLHPPITVTEPVAMGPGVMGPGGMGMMGGGEGGMGEAISGPGPGAGYDPSGPAGGGGTRTYMKNPPYDPQDFSTICNLAFACLLGVLGGAVAQMLNATRPGEQR